MNALQKSAAQASLRVNRKSPTFPAIVVLFSRVNGNTAHEVLTFDKQKDYDDCRTLTVAGVRVVGSKDDLNDVPTATLLKMYNRSRPDSPVDQFPEGGDPRELVFGILPNISTPYEESTMAKAAAPTNSTEAKALEKANKKAEKEAKKAADKAARDAKRADGVIGNIKEALNTKAGVTVEEMLDKLVAKFPTRTRDGMKSTVKIQFSRLQKSTGRTIHNANIEGRGRVYKFEDQGPVPGKIVVPATKAETPAEAKAPATPAPVAEAPAKPAAAAKAAGKKK